MAIRQIESVADIPSTEPDDWDPMELTTSGQVAQLRGRIVNEHGDGLENVCQSCLSFKRDQGTHRELHR